MPGFGPEENRIPNFTSMGRFVVGISMGGCPYHFRAGIIPSSDMPVMKVQQNIMGYLAKGPTKIDPGAYLLPKKSRSGIKNAPK